MKLYFNPASPFVRKVRVVAREIGLDKKIEEVNVLVSPVQANPDLARVNPLVKIPTLLTDDGNAIFDSRVICEYLDSLHSGRKLFPSESAPRWTTLRLQAIADGMLDAGISSRYESVVRPAERQWEEWVEGQKTKWQGALDLLERETSSLEGSPTIGNIAVACALGWFDFRFRQENWRSTHPKLAEWYQTFAERPSLMATAPKA